jgi:hypothetical protein
MSAAIWRTAHEKKKPLIIAVGAWLHGSNTFVGRVASMKEMRESLWIDRLFSFAICKETPCELQSDAACRNCTSSKITIGGM